MYLEQDSLIKPRQVPLRDQTRTGQWIKDAPKLWDNAWTTLYSRRYLGTQEGSIYILIQELWNNELWDCAAFFVYILNRLNLSLLPSFLLSYSSTWVHGYKIWSPGQVHSVGRCSINTLLNAVVTYFIQSITFLSQCN